MVYTITVDEKECIKVFSRANLDDLLRCVTAKASKTTRQCGKDCGQSGLATADEPPRFKPRKRRSNFVKPDSYKDGP